jgi:hypothetical protein
VIRVKYPEKSVRFYTRVLYAVIDVSTVDCVPSVYSAVTTVV